MLPINITSSTFKDIQDLVENGTPESKFLDYKREAKVSGREESKDFLYDIASFANAEGGLIIYGVTERKDEQGHNTGTPEEIIGIEGNVDMLIQAMESLIQSCIEPSIPGLSINSLSDGIRNVLIIGIPKTFGIPHMVTYNKTNKFYRRGNSGKYLPNVLEINDMFLNNWQLYDRLEQFRETRIVEIHSNKYLTNISPEKSVLIHILPFSMFSSQIPLAKISKSQDLIDLLSVLGPYGPNLRPNFEGLLRFFMDANGEYSTYNQLFRNGAIELYSQHFHYLGNNNELVFYGTHFEGEVIRCVNNTIEFYKKIGISPPYVISMSIFGLMEYQMDSPSRFPYRTSPSFLKSDYRFPSLTILEVTDQIDNQLREIFDVLWQTAGLESSPNYRPDGKRVQKR